MSSTSSYASYAQGKGAYADRPSTSSTSYSTASASSTHAYPSSRGRGYNSKPPIIHNGGGQANDPNTSASAPNAGYYN